MPVSDTSDNRQDSTAPSAARMADYLLGDGRNLAPDRRLAEELEHAVPDIGLVVRLSRVFVRHVVTRLMATGTRQFLDLCVGTTTVGNVHEIAQAIDRTSRVVYVHRNPIAVAYTRQLLADTERAAVLQADPREPAKILATCRSDKLLNLTEPIGVLMVGLLPFLPDSANPVKMVAGYRDRIVPGSQLVISHLTGDLRPAETAALVKMMSASLDPVHPRTHEEVVGLFTGFELLTPGVVDVGRWHEERPLDPAEALAARQLYVGVGRKPERA
jgi:hypothetical protein